MGPCRQDKTAFTGGFVVVEGALARKPSQSIFQNLGPSGMFPGGISSRLLLRVHLIARLTNFAYSRVVWLKLWVFFLVRPYRPPVLGYDYPFRGGYDVTGA